MNDRCAYCGRLDYQLQLLTSSLQPPICPCCGHCFECKLLIPHANSPQPILKNAQPIKDYDNYYGQDFTDMLSSKA